MKKEQKKKNRTICSISIPTAVLVQVNDCAAIDGLSRSRWIVEAINEKIIKSEKEEK